MVIEIYVFLKITCFNARKRPNRVSHSLSTMAANTLGEWSDSEDDFVWQIDENNTLGQWSDSEADDLVRNINEDEALTELYGNDDDDELIRNVDEDEALAEWPEGVQMGRGEKRKATNHYCPKKILPYRKREKT